MTTYLAGMRATADRMNDHTADDETTSGLTASTGWTVNDFFARKVSGVTEVHCYLNRSGADLTLSPNPGGNLADTALCVLPTGWRPDHTLSGTWGDGFSSGEAILTSSGTVTLRSAITSITSGRNVRFSATWVSEND